MAQRNTYFQNEIIERKIDIKQLGRTIRYVIPFKKTFLLVGVLMLLSVSFSLISPRLLGYIISNVVYDDGYRKLFFVLFFYCLVGQVILRICKRCWSFQRISSCLLNVSITYLLFCFIDFCSLLFTSFQLIGFTLLFFPRLGNVDP